MSQRSVVEQVEGQEAVEGQADASEPSSRDADQPVLEVVVTKRKLPYNPFMKESLLAVCRNAFAYHRFSTAASLMKMLVLDTRTPHNLIAKAALVLLTQQDDAEFLMHMIKKVMRLDVNKKGLILEVVMELIKKGHHVKVKPFIESNAYVMNSHHIRQSNRIKTFINGYKIYAEYLEWLDNMKEKRLSVYRKFESSLDIATAKLILELRNLIEAAHHTIDIFVFLLLDIFNEHSDEHSLPLETKHEIFDALVNYTKNHPNHLNSHIYLYTFCSKFFDSSQAEELEALKNISRLCPSNVLCLELAKRRASILAREIEMILEMIEYRDNHHCLEAWKQLADKVELIAMAEESVVGDIRQLWAKHFECHWLKLFFDQNRLQEEVQTFGRQLIKCKIIVAEFFVSESCHYVVMGKNLLLQD